MEIRSKIIVVASGGKQGALRQDCAVEADNSDMIPPWKDKGHSPELMDSQGKARAASVCVSSDVEAITARPA